jgi:drug/metabolite transporter (DMT)-like permease
MHGRFSGGREGVGDVTTGLETAPAGNRLAAIGLMCAAVATFSVLDTTAKYLSAEMSTPEIVWARYAGHLLFTLFLFRPRTLVAQLSSRRPWLQFGRGALLILSTLFNFLGVRYLQLTETVSIFFLGPLIVALLSIAFLGEKVGPRRWGAIFVGFLGVMIVVRPGLGGIHGAVLFSFGAVLCYALYSIATRMLAGVDRPETSLLYSALVGVALSTPVLPFFWTWPSGALAWGLFLFMGFCGAVGHYMLILAHQHVGASVLAPFSFTAIIWMAITGYVVFSDVPAWTTLVGAGVVIASSLYLLYRERRVKGEQPAEPGPAMARSGI